MFDLQGLDAALRRRIGGHRLTHTYGVVETAVRLAERYGADVERARVAALMHDYARALPAQELLALGRRFQLVGDELLAAQPILIHGEVGAALLREEGLIGDEAVLAAIAHHTRGRPGMSLLEKVIWVADIMEPGRNFPGVERIRQLAWEDLDLGLLAGLEQTLAYLLASAQPIHPDTVLARNGILAELAGRGQSWAGTRYPG